MAINLAEKYEPKLDARFTKRSLTEPFIGSDYNWEGAHSIKVWTLDSVELNDYTAEGTNRFGTPTEVGDELNIYTLQKKRSFAATFDVTNVQDQMFTKKATSYLKQMWDERYIPEIDTYRLGEWAKYAGQGKVGSALTKTTIMEEILNAHAALDEANVPSENRVTFLRTDVSVKCKLADELKNQQNWVNKAILQGKIAEINGSPVVAVPSSRMPAGVEFMVKYKKASADPNKLKMLRAHNEAPGIAGVLMEGLCRFDAFVLAQKADGIYVYSTTGAAAPEIAISGGKATITGEGTIYYTIDGSNPKSSANRQVYSAAVTVPAGAKVRAYAEVSGKLHSAIASKNA
jgi:hypothetical protein